MLPENDRVRHLIWWWASCDPAVGKCIQRPPSCCPRLVPLQSIKTEALSHINDKTVSLVLSLSLSFSLSLSMKASGFDCFDRQRVNASYLPATSILKRLAIHSTISSPGWDGDKYSYGYVSIMKYTSHIHRTWLIYLATNITASKTTGFISLIYLVG